MNPLNGLRSGVVLCRNQRDAVSDPSRFGGQTLRHHDGKRTKLSAKWTGLTLAARCVWLTSVKVLHKFFLVSGGRPLWQTNIENLQICIKVLLCQRDFAGNVSIWRAIPTPPDMEGERPMNAANIATHNTLN